MVKDIYESICRGEDVRANLICLKQLIADKKEKSAFAYMLAGDFRKLAALLKDKDAKIRKNAALILGELESEEWKAPISQSNSPSHVPKDAGRRQQVRCARPFHRASP